MWADGAGGQTAAHPAPAVSPFLGWCFRLGWRCGRRVWSYREVFLVFFVAPFVAAVLLRAPVLVPVFVVLLFGALVVPAWRSSVSEWMQKAGRRHYVHRIERGWPEICRTLGWHREFGKDGSGQSRLLIPALLRVGFERDGQVLVIVVKPTASQPRAKWGEMTDQARRFLGVPVAHWDEPAPGVVRMSFAREPLPRSVPFPVGVRPEGWWRLRLGVRGGGEEVAWRPVDVPHLLVGGVTSGGKGSAPRSIIYEALLTAWLVFVINPKLSGEYRWAELLGVPVLETLGECLEQLERLEAERVRRQAIVRAAGVGSWHQVPGWSDPPMLLLVDGVSALLMVDKTDKAVAKKQEQAGALITRLVQLGRSAGVHLVLATQRPDVSSLGPNGGILRDNLDGRLGICSLQDAGLAMLFGSGLDPDVKTALDGTKGRALGTMLSAGDFDIYPMQLYWLDERDLMKNPPRPLTAQR